MFRKSLFLGLTMMLAAALVYLVIQGRRQEKQRQTTSRPVEIVRESPPSLTRVIAPDDIGIIESKMELGSPGAQAGPAGSAGVTATHHFVIRNNGRTAYHSFVLKLSYIGHQEKVLETRMVPVAEMLQPGQVRSIAEIKVENVPAGATRCIAKIASADLEPAPAKP
jgi:hypothetical protein